MTVTIGVLSDTHIPDRARELPKEVLEAFKSVDMVVHAGDLVDIKVLEKLKSVCKDVRAVWGNMDPEETRKRLHEKEIFSVGKYRIGLMHGWGPPNRLTEVLTDAFKNDKVDVIIFGHSHQGFNQKKGNILFFNPGSLTDKVFAPYNSYGILRVNDTVEGAIVKL